MVRPLRSSQKQIKDALFAGNYFLKYGIDSKSREELAKIIRAVKSGHTSKKKYSINGRYVPQRAFLHAKIVNSILKTGRYDGTPEIFVFGGVAGSGKTKVLGRMLQRKVMTINNDDIKAILAKYDRSPVEKYPLLHAQYLHDEASDIEDIILRKAIAQKKDMVLDRTLASYKKNKQKLQDLTKQGYKIYLLGTNLYPHIAIIRAGARSLKEGRFVPLEYIAKNGNKTNSSVLRMAKQPFISKAIVFNTVKSKPKLMYKRGL